MEFIVKFPTLQFNMCKKREHQIQGTEYTVGFVLVKNILWEFDL